MYVAEYHPIKALCQSQQLQFFCAIILFRTIKQ
jgi:hypothetical protein